MKTILSGLSKSRFLTMASLLAAAATAPAAVIHLDLSATPQNIPNTLDGLYLNLATATLSTASIPNAGWDINVYNSGTGLAFFAPATPSGQGTLTSGSAALSLLAGAAIGSGGLYLAGPTPGTTFLTLGIHFAGFRFHNELSGADNYGWLKLNTAAGNGFPASLLGYAYEDGGNALLAGQIPEPAAPPLLALGLLTATARRRRASLF